MGMGQICKTDSNAKDVSKPTACGEIRMEQEREDMGTRIERAGKSALAWTRGSLGETGQEAPGWGGGV